MQSPDPNTAERQAIHSALLRVEHRLRLNRTVHAAALCGGLTLLALITWRVLAWLGGTAPAAAALIVLLAIITGFGLLLLLAQCLLRSAVDVASAASEADQRGGLHDELLSALWFMRGDGDSRPVARAWIGVQLQRAARTASGLHASHLVPMRLPRGLLAGLCAGVVVLALTWSSAPLTPAQEVPTPSVDTGAKAGDAQVQALRELIDALPRTEARRKLEAALQALEHGSANADERRQAVAQAQQAVDQIKLDAAASREGLQKLSQMLAGQQGMEEVAQALARGDAQRAAELIAKAQRDREDDGSGNAPMPPDAQGDTPSEQGKHALTDVMAEAQGARPNAEALQLSVERLKQIARELKAANFVNEAWKEVAGPQMQNARTRILAAGRDDEQQARVDGTPSPGSSDKPMGGGTQLRSGVVGQGQGLEEQDGGTRMGDAIGDGKVDPLLGEGGERLDAQLKQHALEGQEDAQQNPDQQWFYAASQKRGAQTAWRTIDARTRFSEAQASTAAGIAISHRQITRDFFMKRPEVTK